MPLVKNKADKFVLI